MAQTRRKPKIDVEPRIPDDDGKVAAGFIYYFTPDRNEQVGRIGFGLELAATGRGIGDYWTPLWTTQWREPDDHEVLAAVKALAKFHDKLSVPLAEALIDTYPAYREAVEQRQALEARKR